MLESNDTTLKVGELDPPRLKSLLEKARSYYPQEEIERLTMRRKRPRRTGKPL